MKQAPDGAARLAELQYLLRYGNCETPKPPDQSWWRPGRLGRRSSSCSSRRASYLAKSWSGWPDLNRRPLRPEANAMRCAIAFTLSDLLCAVRRRPLLATVVVLS
jgi:hypothetical protein